GELPHVRTARPPGWRRPAAVPAVLRGRGAGAGRGVPPRARSRRRGGPHPHDGGASVGIPRFDDRGVRAGARVANLARGGFRAESLTTMETDPPFMGFSVKAEHLRRYRDIAALFMKYGRTEMVRGAGLEDLVAPEPAAPSPKEAELPEQLAADLEKMG